MPEWVFMVAGQVLTAAAIWGGIRADLRNVKQSTDEAHKRIDRLLERRHQ